MVIKASRSGHKCSIAAKEMRAAIKTTPCRLCTRGFTNDEMVTHYRRVHQQYKHLCAVCSNGYKRECERIVHEEEEHGEEEAIGADEEQNAGEHAEIEEEDA